MILKSNKTITIALLEFDELICLKKPYGGCDVEYFTGGQWKIICMQEDELRVNLFDSGAKGKLEIIYRELQPKYVLSMSWRCCRCALGILWNGRFITHLKRILVPIFASYTAA